MHLRAIKLRGFKSFPDPVEVRLEPGVAVVVGPNGSGKSNIADALIWAAGSLAPSELRAEKPDDVLFAGSSTRPAAPHCEVELVFDNEDGALAELDFSEVSIVRRLHRGGEGQYLVNGASVRRTDVVELLSDVGLGHAMGSIVSQGRVEAILASKPEERRVLVEEAAGLGRFKRRRHRAELKLARVATQVERARDVEAEVAKRLRPLALQATAAERAEKLTLEIAALRAGIAAIDVRSVDAQIASAGSRRGGLGEERAKLEGALEALLVERRRAEEALADAAGGREGSTATLYRVRSATERLELRLESAQALVERLQEPAPLVDAGLLEQARLADTRAAALERAIAEREGLPPAARALAEEGATLALTQVEAEPGYERAAAAAVGAALVARTPEEGLDLLEQARRRGLGNLTVLIRRGELPALDGNELVARAELLEAAAPAVTREGHFYDPDRGVLSFTGDTAEAVLLELEAERRALVEEAAELRRRAEQTTPRMADPALVSAAAALLETLAAAIRAAERLQAPLLAEADRGADHASRLAEELRALGGREVELRRALSEASERGAAVDVELARLEAERAEAVRRVEQAGGAEPADGAREELAEKLERLERRREQLGGVNPFAKEEYAREKERLSELRTQREDLERSLDELRKLRDELTETVDRRFTETFDAVQRNFAEVAGTLFPGGKGRLRLTEPEEEGEEPGIEVELSPAGKRITRLSLLSGGEKALGAISFLFALFLARPCPFYLLDEVEAALDDTNIGRFCALLRRFADRAQFIVITHQKRTMEAADALYGVTMGADGVSQVVSRKLPREEAATVAA
ncbi:MAG TPA: chromosome segregation SMC family protein [Gaiellaceae bacterium]|nr:chromosome segregation SMC family protein [Gaiellaceae bacterium]